VERERERERLETDRITKQGLECIGMEIPLTADEHMESPLARRGFRHTKLNPFLHSS